MIVFGEVIGYMFFFSVKKYSLLVRVADKCDGVFIAPHNEGGGRGGCAIVGRIGWS